MAIASFVSRPQNPSLWAYHRSHEGWRYSAVSSVVRQFIDGAWIESDPVSSALAHVTLDEAVDALKNAGYVVRYQQVVLDRPDGQMAEVNVEPV